MTFVNEQIDRDLLPRFDEVELHGLDPRYPAVELGCALLVVVPGFLFVTILFFVVLIPVADMPRTFGIPLYGLIVAFLTFIAWYTHKAASLIRYAVRRHDVIVRKGVFWKRETIQPIKRIQHVEQHQGPVDKRFGLYALKLFSAGTGHFTFEIPGLDADMAAGIRQHVLTVKQQDWSDDRVGDARPDASALPHRADGEHDVSAALPHRADGEHDVSAAPPHGPDGEHDAPRVAPRAVDD